MNTSQEVNSKDCCNSAERKWFVQVKTTLSSFTSNIIREVYHHLRHHSCSKLIKYEVRNTKAAREKDTAKDN